MHIQHEKNLPPEFGWQMLFNSVIEGVLADALSKKIKKILLTNLYSFKIVWIILQMFWALWASSKQRYAIILFCKISFSSS